MSMVLAANHRVLTTDRDADLARGVLRELGGPQGELFVADQGSPQPLPRELRELLQRVLEAVASGQGVTVTTVPSELTTSAAAGILGISRPTLIKMAREGRISSHQVGSHMRFHSEDILAERAARRERERAAFRELRDIELD